MTFIILRRTWFIRVFPLKQFIILHFNQIIRLGQFRLYSLDIGNKPIFIDSFVVEQRIAVI
jgi:hypothetical protein